MKKLILKWLGICQHETWDSVGVFMSREGATVLGEMCTQCKMVNFYRV